MTEDVRVAIDMNRKNEGMIPEGDPDTLELDEIIGSKIEEGIDLVHLEAPLYRLEAIEMELPEVVEVDREGKGSIDLPEDFLRLVAFRIEGWRRTVHEPIRETDPIYSLQSSKWRGIYGTPEKPVVALTHNGGPVPALEFYSTDGRWDEDKEKLVAEITRASYVPKASIEGKEVFVSRDCYKATVYRIAGLVLASMGDQLAGTMTEMSAAVIKD